VIRRIHGNIWVNAEGKRFHNEVDYGADRGTRAYMAQDPPRVWSLLDSAMVRNAEVVDPYYREGDAVFVDRVMELFDQSPYIKKDANIENLAPKIGVSPAALAETVRSYNRSFEQRLTHDPQFGKPLTGLTPLDHPPFYAVQFGLLARKSLGGAATNLRGQVLNRKLEPIPGLFAAGELASPAGCHIGYLGHTIGQCLLSGRLAGAGASSETGHGDGTLR
jgi:fumarate reductase flavoprotein subunit